MSAGMGGRKPHAPGAGGPRVVLVVGPRDAGKTAYARALAERARRAGLRVAGFLSEAELEDGAKARYHLRDLAGGGRGRRTLVASTRPEPGLTVRVGRHHLDPAAFRAAERALRRAADADLVCIDEVGPLELAGGGFRPALDRLLVHFRGILVLTARPAVAEALAEILAAARAAGDCPAAPDPRPSERV